MNSMLPERIATVRRFNRGYTKLIGALDEGTLHTDYSLAEARVIFELGSRQEAEVGELRAALGLDAGYLSRILSRFEREGLVLRAQSARDARRQRVRLTPGGESMFRTLDERADGQVSALLDGLGESKQRDVVAAMQTIEASLGGHARSPIIVVRSPRAGDFGWVVERHGALYSGEYGWDRSFEALVARIVADFVDRFDAPHEAAWIAEVDGERAGCVFCVRVDDETAKLRLLLVEPSARGCGVGARLVDECVSFARAAGFRRIELWTNDVLVAARRIYERAGFQLIDAEEHDSFGHHLIGQAWRLELIGDS